MAHRQNMKAQLIDTVTEVCRNILQFESELTVEGLLGITIDNSEIILVNVNETLKRPVDITVSLTADVPGISNPEALSTYLADYFPYETSSVSKLPKRKRHGPPLQNSFCANTGPSSPNIVKQKRHFSESCSLSFAAHVDDKSTSDNCSEANVFRSSEAGAAGKTAKESSQMLIGYLKPQFNLKLENSESIANCDDDTEQSERDESLNIDRYLSASCQHSNNVDAATDNDNDGDSAGNMCRTFEHQSSDSPNSHSVTDDSSRLVISNVFTVKQEPMFGHNYIQQSPTLQRSCASENILCDETQVSNPQDHVTAASHSDTLQVGYTLLCN